jgi:hypothetical protein
VKIAPWRSPVKAASDIYAPISGEIVAVNGELESSPELVNSEPYGDGFLFQIKAADEGELANLLDAAALSGLDRRVIVTTPQAFWPGRFSYRSSYIPYHASIQEFVAMTQTLSQLEHSEAFIERHIGSSAEQRQELLAAVGARSLSALIPTDRAGGHSAAGAAAGRRRGGPNTRRWLS